MKICIMGAANNHVYTPFSDREWSIWGLNHRYWMYERSDLYFEMHSNQHYKNPKFKKYFNWLKDNQDKVILQKYDNELPNCRVYSASSTCPVDVTSSLHHLLWYIIDHCPMVTEVMLTGINLSANGEYGSQRKGVYFCINALISKNIKVLIPKQCSLFSREKDYKLQSYNKKFNLILKAPDKKPRKTGYVYGIAVNGR